MKRKAVSILCLITLLLTSCGNGVVATDQPGNGKWVVSDINGTVKESDEIRLEDDFAAASNKDYLVSASEGDSTFMAAADNMRKGKMDILNNLSDEGEEYEIKKYTELASDWDYRNEQGVEPLRKYIEEVEKISSIDELTNFQKDPTLNPFALGVFMPKQVIQSPVDPSIYNITVTIPDLSLGSIDEYYDISNDGLQKSEYIKKISEHVLGKLGYDKKKIDNIVKGNFRFEKKLADCDKVPAGSMEKDCLIDYDKCIESAKGYPLQEIFDGWEVPHDAKFYMFKESSDAAVKLYNNNNLEDIKSMFIIHLVLSSSCFLDRETYDLDSELQESKLQDEDYGYEPSEEELNQDILFEMINKSICSVMLDKQYIEKNYDDETISEVNSIANDILDKYHDLFKNEKWMSDEGKEKCIEKLDAIKVHAVKPDFDMFDYSGFSVVSKSDGGSLLDAYAESTRYAKKQMIGISSKPYDRSKWNPFTVSTTNINAFYMSTENSIYILAGIICEPFYSKDMQYEEKLAKIGTIIGHEITHGFDKDGSLYNKEGVKEKFLPNVDIFAFTDRTNKVSNYFTTVKPFPGSSPYSGLNVTGEATADMGGVRICLMVAEDIDGFDYDLFFRSYASLWRTSSNEKAVKNQFSMDEHPLNYLRINITLQQFDEFYETYDIKPGDAMYLAKEKRISVW